VAPVRAPKPELSPAKAGKRDRRTVDDPQASRQLQKTALPSMILSAVLEQNASACAPEIEIEFPRTAVQTLTKPSQSKAHTIG